MSITVLTRFLSDSGQPRRKELARLLSMMGLYFLVLFAVGILKPIRNSLALDGLAEGDFYQVYLVSALVILFAPAFNHLADRIQWRVLIPATAAFFAANLVLFRALYSEGSAVLGMIFYGWYDLFAAALVTQFFMAVQIFFNARDAKSAVPLVIAAGSVGATFGGITTGVLARTIGTPNLLFVAASFVAVFSLALPFVWTGYAPVRPPGSKVRKSAAMSASGREFVRVFSNRHIRLIASLVLLTVIVKQLVDYEFNEAVAAYAGDRDAISSFQGYVFGAINWLPILVLLPLGPLLKRWGVGFAVLMLPVAMLGFTAALAAAFSVWTATLAKAGDATFRYSAEQTGREVLYVPVPTELKLKAKAYVDVAVEKGFGKGFSGLLIAFLVLFMEYSTVAWVAVVLALVWCIMALAAKREYVNALADSIRGRFAGLEGGFASLTERSTLAMVEEALRGDTVDVGFGLELVEQAGSVDARHLADELELLLEHPETEVRVRVLRLLERFPDLVEEERIRGRLEDTSARVREAAVGALVARRPDEESTASFLEELLRSKKPERRLAAIAWLADSRTEKSFARRLCEEHAGALLAGAGSAQEGEGFLSGADLPTRLELAHAACMLDRGPLASKILARLLVDDNPDVVAAAITSAGKVGSADLRVRLVSALADPSLRGRATQALVSDAPEAISLYRKTLTDPEESSAIRRNLPSVLARVDGQASVNVLLAALSDPRTPPEIRYPTLKALNKLRSRDVEELDFDSRLILPVAAVEVEEARRLARFRSVLSGSAAGGERGPGMALLDRALTEAWEERREATFRLLGLVFPPDDVYRSHFALTRTDERARANALEWLERTLGRELFTRILPVLEPEPGRIPVGKELDREGVLRELSADPDPWLASIARWNLENFDREPDERMGDRLDRIEKVFLLQKVDLLQGARSSHLALLASIAEVVDVDPGEVLMEAGGQNDSLYVIVRGKVELSGVGDQTLVAEDETPFGTWSLIDSDPSVVGARAVAPTRLIRITRSDFQELLADHPQLATGMLEGLARRVRSLVA